MANENNTATATPAPQKQGCLGGIFSGIFKIVNGLFMLIPGFRNLPTASQNAISGLTIVVVFVLAVVCMPKHETPPPPPKTPVQEIESAISSFKNPGILGFGEGISIESAIKSLETAADAGVVAAMPILADIYRNGKFGKTINSKTADKWESKHKELSASGAEGVIVISEELEEELKQTIRAYEQKKAEEAAKKAEEEAKKKELEEAKSALGSLFGAAAGAIKDATSDAVKKEIINSATESISKDAEEVSKALEDAVRELGTLSL